MHPAPLAWLVYDNQADLDLFTMSVKKLYVPLDGVRATLDGVVLPAMAMLRQN